MKRHGSMNHIYRLVWSCVVNGWIAVAETTRGRGKGSRRKLTAAALSLTAACFAAPPAQAGPSGGQVVSGAGNIAQSGVVTTITQASQNLSLNWASFNIAPQETVNFVQPSASAIAVNRILGANGTQILGSLNANGQVFLINPNGILFGQGAQVNVGGLVASTLDVNDAGLGGNTLSFGGSGSGSIVNQGTINAANGGYVALLGNHVSNQGVITAQLGAVALGAGNAVTLTFSGNSLLHMQVDQSVLNSLAENGGLIQADGGTVVMTAGAKDALLASVVNNTGVIEARTVANHEGAITLLGGMAAGTVNLGGTLDASAPNGGNGGAIETSAAHVEVANGAKVTTAAAMGTTGSWLLDPVDFTISATGDISAANLSTMLSTSSVTIETNTTGTNTPSQLYGASGTSGNIYVDQAGVAWSANTLTLSAQNNIYINAALNASGSAQLALQYGQGSASGVIGGVTATYNVNAPVNLPAGAAASSIFTTKLGSSGPTISYNVIDSLGVAGDASGAPSPATSLQGMATTANLGGHYVLGSNIDATATSGWNAGAGFTPIGNATINFTGTFDGLGHTITNLAIDANLANSYYLSNNFVGLFGYTGSSSVIQNVGLVGDFVTVEGQHEAVASGFGALVGYNNGTISNSYATGSVASYTYTQAKSPAQTGIGGLVGVNNGTISNSYVNCSNCDSVLGFADGGGLVGYNTNKGAISNSYATGNVIIDHIDGGGLVGGNVGTISNSYATGTVSGGAGGGNVGGLVGYNSGGVNNSYATGAVSAPGGADVGGLVGGNAGTITDAYWNSDVNSTGVGSGSSSGAVGLSTAQMQTATNFTGFVWGTSGTTGVGNSWVMVDADGTLNNAGSAPGATFPMLTSEYSSTIVNAHQLQLIALAPGASYTLGANIDASATAAAAAAAYGSDVWSTAGGFVPIGNDVNPFTGTFDGLGHTITNLAINLTSSSDVGLFGYTGSSSVIQNVGLVGGGVSGGVANSVGGLVGDNYGTISNSYATGSVSGTLAYVGGLVGGNAGTISNSYATGSVSGTANATSSFVVGGLVGGNAGTISNSYATGAVTETAASLTFAGGGLAGLNFGTISNSYATGSVRGSLGDEFFYAGGLVGYNYTGTISNSFYDSSVNPGLSGIGSSTGGLADVAGTVWGMSTPNMKMQANFTSATTANGNVNPNWNFGTTPVVWAIVPAVNAGYPCLVGVTLSCIYTPTSTTTIYLDLIGGGSSTYGNSPIFSYVYDTSPTVGSGTVITTAAPTGTITWSGAPTASSSVGTYSVTYGSGITLGNSAYTLSAGNAVNYGVTPATLTVSGETAGNKVYDGANTAVLSGGSLSSFIGSVTLIQTGTFASPNVGTGVAVTAADTLSGAGAGNYTMVQPTGLSANITPVTLTYTATAAGFIAGQTPSALLGTLSGFVAGDTQANATSGTLGWTTPAVAASQPGQYAIDGGGLIATNYVFAEAPGNATALTVKPGTPPVQVQNAMAVLESTQPFSNYIEATTGDARVPGLRIVDGGVRLPNDLVNFTEN